MNRKGNKQMKILNAIFKGLSWIVTIAVIACVTALLVLPIGFKIKPYVVQSGSMEPAIHTGSLVWINTRDTDVAVGDIVAYRVTDATYVTHRIIDTEDGAFITKGDANETQDLKPVLQEQIMGKYMFTVPEVGYFLADIQSKPILIIPILALLLSILLVSSALEDAVKEQEKAAQSSA